MNYLSDRCACMATHKPPRVAQMLLCKWCNACRFQCEFCQSQSLTWTWLSPSMPTSSLGTWICSSRSEHLISTPPTQLCLMPSLLHLPLHMTPSFLLISITSIYKLSIIIYFKKLSIIILKRENKMYIYNIFKYTY